MRPRKKQRKLAFCNLFHFFAIVLTKFFLKGNKYCPWNLIQKNDMTWENPIMFYFFIICFLKHLNLFLIENSWRKYSPTMYTYIIKLGFVWKLFSKTTKKGQIGRKWDDKKSVEMMTKCVEMMTKCVEMMTKCVTKNFFFGHNSFKGTSNIQ